MRATERDAARTTERDAARAVKEARRERLRVERAEMRRFTRRSRHRRLAWVIAGSVIVAVSGASVALAFSPLMSVRDIDVSGATSVNAAQVRAALSGEIGTPLPLVNQEQVRKVLSRFTSIQSYSVESHPPNTLVISVVERTPIAVVQQSASSWRTVDAADVTLATSSSRPAGYPAIAVSGSSRTNAATFQAAVAVVRSLPASIRSRVDTVTASTPDDVSFTLTGGAATVVWGDAQQASLKAADVTALLTAKPSGVTVYDVSSPQTVTTR